jgi:hypothetical protein
VRAPPSIRISPSARRHVEANGGVLYLWVAPKRPGGTFGFLETATDDPGGIPWTVREIDGLTVHVHAGMRAVLARPVRVRLWRIPRTRLEASGAVTVGSPG